jgi:hypothetical protein
VIHGVNQTIRMDTLLAHASECPACKKRLAEAVAHAKEEGWQLR